MRYSLVLCVIASLLPVAPVHGCLWDSDTVHKELDVKKTYEFKSGNEDKGSFESPASPPAAGPVAWSGTGVGLMLSGVGFMVIAGAFVCNDLRKSART